MCEPISATLGVVSALGSGMQAIGAHQQQAAAVARSNAIAQQQYQRQLQIAAAQDQEKARTYEAQLKAATASRNAYHRQVTANQAEANRALAASAANLRQKSAAAAFESQRAVAKAVQAQGSVLATGRSGQSFLLQTMDSQRVLGLEQAEINRSMYDASAASGVEQHGILLDQNAANVAAWNNLPANPLSPQASFIPIKPMKQQGPSGLALAGGLIGSAASGFSAGIGAHATMKEHNLFGVGS